MEKKENSTQEKIRVLIVDDSFFMKKLLREILESDSRIEVIGEAKDGEEAVFKIQELKPEVVTLDYNMPKLNGLEVIKKVLASRQGRPPAILMLSAHTDKDSPVTWECLRAGAVDFIVKPSGELSLDIGKMGGEIISKVIVASHSQVKISPEIRLEKIKEKTVPLKGTEEAEKIVIIGSSTGGPPVVEEILSKIPTGLEASLIVVQHMPSFFTSRFATRLDELSPATVKEAQEKNSLLKETVLVAPSVSGMEVKKDCGTAKIYLKDDPRFEGARPNIDSVMESAAKVFKQNTIGVILSGMGNDGLAGAREIKKQGGHVIIQKPETTVVDSMPVSILQAGLADEILAPDEIGKRIGELVKN